MFRDRRSCGVGDRAQPDALVRVGRRQHGGDEAEVGGSIAPAEDGQAAPGDARINAQDGALEHLFAAV